jgi:hypothetical protein
MSDFVKEPNQMNDNNQLTFEICEAENEGSDEDSDQEESHSSLLVKGVLVHHKNTIETEIQDEFVDKLGYNFKKIDEKLDDYELSIYQTIMTKEVEQEDYCTKSSRSFLLKRALISFS